MTLAYVSAVLTLVPTAWATNDTNTTSQDSQRQGWTPEPNSASGTASIIWQCLTTIGLCTYTAVHLNIPPTQLSSTANLGRKVLTIFFALIAPELWAWYAVSELLAARDFVKRCEQLDWPISLKQAFFICSGGIQIKALHAIIPSFKPIGLEERPVTVHSGSTYFRRWKEKRVVDIADDEILFLVENVPSDGDIDDKSKADGLVKSITSLQAFWTFIQIVARGQQFGASAISLIQVATLGYIAMAAFAYCCWWHKPYDIGRAHVVGAHLALENGRPRVNATNWFCSVTENPEQDASILRWLPHFFLARLQQFIRAIMTFGNDMSNRVLTLDAILLGALVVVFAALHCIAWNYSFPTIAEARLWQTFMVGSVLFGLSIIMVNILLRFGPLKLDHYEDPETLADTLANKLEKAEDIWIAIPAILFLVYDFGRFYMMIECFISFRDASRSIYYQVDWSAYVPHFGA